MVTHPDTATQVARLDYQERLRNGARGYLAEQATDTRRTAAVVQATRGVVGAVLVAVGQRLQGGSTPLLSPATAGER